MDWIIIFLVSFVLIILGGLTVLLIIFIRRHSTTEIPSDCPLIRNWMTYLSNGYAFVILLETHSANRNTDGRVLYKCLPQDIPYVNGVAVRAKPIYVPAKPGQLKLIPKGDLSNYRVVGDLFPPTPEELPESFRNSTVGQMYVNAVTHENIRDSAFVAQRLEIEGGKKIMKGITMGEDIDLLINTLQPREIVKVEEQQQKKDRVIDVSPSKL